MPGRFARALVLWLTFFVSGAVASDDILCIGIKPAPPFVIINERATLPRGFSIDIIEEIARSIAPDRPISYHVDSDLMSHLNSVETARVDLGIAATTITAERERRVDFSHPFFAESFETLESRKASALIHDASLIQYVLKTRAVNPDKYVLITEGLQEFSYGIALPRGSLLREQVNRALLRLMEGEKPVYGSIRDTWF